MKYRLSPGEQVFDILTNILLFMVMAITLYPFIYVLSMSISDPIYVVQQAIWLLPKGFALKAYKLVFENSDIWQAYYNSIWYTVIGTAVNVGLTITTAYPLSRRNFFAAKPVMLMIVFTMYFSGGLIPSFILVNNLGLYNTRWAIILPVAISAFNVILARTFFANIPESLSESAKIDGANDISIVIRIIIPLSGPIIAVLILFYAVSRWNSYFTAMLYLPDSKLQPVQLYLVKILVQNQANLIKNVSEQFDRSMILTQVKYAAIIIVILPILMVYPFVQKYFVKGVMLGAIKE